MEKVLVIVGPTGVGKTSLSIQLAKRFQGEIISGDSMQVYKHMSIGTAKIKEEEMQHVPHYLIDQFDITQDYNVKEFQRLSRIYMDEIREKQKLPMLVGGTGLYIKSTIYDYIFTEQEEDVEFMNFLQNRSQDELWSLLQIVDNEACTAIHKHNRQRIIRALYMAHTGVKKSEIVRSQQHLPMYDAYIIGLTMNREALYDRINQRVDRMMEEGLLEEIQELVQTHEDVWNLQSFQGIGYKEWKAHFEEGESIETCVERIKKNSRNFAKRQYTWFQNQMQVHWYDIEDSSYPKNVYDEVKAWLDK